MSRVSDASQSLKTSWQRVRLNWQDACTAWNDSVRQDFEHQYWHEFETRIPRVIGEMDSLDRVIEQARRSTP
jgi:hypothetical protein